MPGIIYTVKINKRYIVINGILLIVMTLFARYYKAVYSVISLS